MRAGAVGGELGAKVGLALARGPHPPREVVEELAVERPRPNQPGGLDHDPLVGEPARVRRHAARRGAADVRVVGAAGGEAEQVAVLALGLEDGRDQRDVGEVGPAPIGVVEDPGVAGGVLLVEHGRDRRRHRAEVDRDVLGLHHHLALGVEQGGGGVATLLHVRGVGGTDEHRAHLVAGGAQRAEHDLEVDGVHQSRSTTTVPSRDWSVACQPGGMTSVASDSSTIAGPSTAPPIPPRWTAVSSSLPSKRASRLPAVPALSASGSSDAGSGPGIATATRTVTSSSSASGSE
jgi:hypothetical protein